MTFEVTLQFHPASYIKYPNDQLSCGVHNYEDQSYKNDPHQHANLFTTCIAILYNLPLPQSSLHSKDTVKSTTPNSCMSRSELSHTRCGRRVNFPSRLADYRSSNALGGEYRGVHNANKAD
ncbi:hypothetical protein ACTXT7_001168 [Hymenolepis weldensis]